MRLIAFPLVGVATLADAESEQLGRQALDRMADQRTTIVIAHRLATAQKADRIVVMENGRSVEQVCIRTSRKDARFAALQFNRRHGEDGKAASLIVAGTGVGFPKGTQTRSYVSCLRRRPTITGGHANYN